jgi:predicted small lipoprotein YifL
MKNLFKVALMMLAMSMFVACGTKTTEEAPEVDSTVVIEEPIQEMPADTMPVAEATTEAPVQQ